MDRTHVAALLGAHTPADMTETTDWQTILDVIDSTDERAALFDKTWVSPGHFTASAVVTNPARSHILLIHHPAFGLWIQPGGHTDPTDASLPHAAARELAEETGLRTPVVRPLGLLDVAVHQVPDGIKGQPAHLHFDLRFAFEARLDTPVQAEAASAVAWFAIDTLRTVQTDASVRAAARRLQRFGA